MSRRRSRAQSSIYRGVSWDRGTGVRSTRLYRAEITVRGQRYKLGRWRDERDAARAYDLACEQLGVPERRNFGAHKPYDDLTLLRAGMRVCRRCRGVGLIGGEFHPRGGPGSHGRFLKLGRWRECGECGGAGYLLAKEVRA
jgi:hypothetical protein